MYLHGKISEAYWMRRVICEINAILHHLCKFFKCKIYALFIDGLRNESVRSELDLQQIYDQIYNMVASGEERMGAQID